MPKHDYEALTDELALAQAELIELKRFSEQYQHEARQWRRSAIRLTQQLDLTQSLNLTLFTAPDPASMYQLLCQALVYQLGWDSAIIITMHGTQPVLHGWQGMTVQQIDQLRDYLQQNAAFQHVYQSGTGHATAHRRDKEDLSLRSLFKCDELMAAPIQFGDQRYAYVVVTASHDRAHLREQDELGQLESIATLVAHAVQYNEAFANLEEQNRHLRHLDDLKDSFISIASHQLRTPLSIIKWILSALRTDESVKALAEPSELIEQAYATNERLIHEVNQLLNVSRIQEGRLHVDVKPSSLRDLVDDAVGSVGHAAEQRHMEIAIESDAELPAFNLDRLLFRDALQNVIQNAIDYGDEGTPIHIELKRHGKHAVLTIANTGIGVLPDDQEKLFSQFFRAQNAMLIQPNGNGLGLFIAKAVIEQHQGTIKLASKPGKQTTVTISLPLPADD